MIFLNLASLTIDHSGAQGWVPEYRDVRN